jgi:hypothetical protein
MFREVMAVDGRANDAQWMMAEVMMCLERRVEVRSGGCAFADGRPEMEKVVVVCGVEELRVQIKRGEMKRGERGTH